MASKRTYSGGYDEDKGAIESAYGEAIKEYAGSLDNFRATDMVQLFHGDTSALARNLAGIGAGKLPRRGTEERKHYETQKRNVNRWLAQESGRAVKEKRNIGEATQARFKELYARQNPPSGRMSASITGWIKVSNDVRYRSIEIPPLSRSRGEIDTDAFTSAMAQGDTSAAYAALFNAYAPGGTVVESTSFSINFEE